jgi:uncharacterized damage-inducible protein DinB
MANTRKVLERVPDDKLSYKPDPKSMTLGRLAGHVAEMVGWGAAVLQADSFNISPDFKALDPTSRQQVLAELDKNASAVRTALAATSDDAFQKPWRLTMGDHEIFNLPRLAVFRSMVMNHMIHHRAQLTVYFRLTGVPVPGLYGPSADEQQSAGA